MAMLGSLRTTAGAERRFYGGMAVVILAVAILGFARTYFLRQILPVPTDTSRIAAMTESALQTWSAIVAGSYYPNPGPMNCSTRPYRSRCPAHGGRGTQ